ncbi:hypothetical protein IFR41_00995 [Pseudomonas fluorescens]|nr:hypothetical protein [Pseudomonas fluorescens]TKK11090.1 hypothetical protein PflCFBP13514_04170 [Pseudomonas fluorescens]
MAEPPAYTPSLAAFTAEQTASGPFLTRDEWSSLQALDAVRSKFDGFLDGLDDEEKREYVRLQKAWVQARKAVEDGVPRFIERFEQQSLASLRDALKTLTGSDVDPKTARIYTRYLAPARRVRREAQGDQVKVASLTLWEAACMNYDGVTGWSFPGNTGIADASYMDSSINASAAAFIALVRKLNIGETLRTSLAQALRASSSLGDAIMRQASAEFEFALINALKDRATSRVDKAKYHQLKRALVGEVRWGQIEEMHLFIPHGIDNISWVPQHIGLTGQYVGSPPGDSVKIPHIVFSVSGCKGAFSYFPHRPSGALLHYDSHREACTEFYMAFQASYGNGDVSWLYPLMTLRDSVRLKQIATSQPRPEQLSPQAEVLYDLVEWLPKTTLVKRVGYVRQSVEKTPMVCLHDFYTARCRTNLQELAAETPGWMVTISRVFQTVLGETLDLLLIPAPGPLKGLGRLRAVAMFAVLTQSLIEGGAMAVQGDSVELLQTLVDLADLLISSRLHTRLARSVMRRHQALYRQLSPPGSVAGERVDTALLERMLSASQAPVKSLNAVLEASNTPRQLLDKVWEGERPSASLVEASQRFNVDRLIDWASSPSPPSHPPPTQAFEVLGPLVTQLAQWPVDTALSVENPQGLELRRYTQQAGRPASRVVTVTRQENFQFAYSSPRRFTANFLQAVVDLLPAVFSAGEPPLRQQLALRARTVRLELFEALTRFAQADRATASGAPTAIKNLLPERVGSDQPEPAVISTLRALHPEVSLPRLLEVLDQQPLSSHQQTQLLASQLQPEALYTALRSARRAARREAMIDGIFHGRRYDAQTLRWAGEFAGAVLKSVTGQALVISRADQPVHYMSKGAKDRTVVVLDHGRGRFAPFDHRTSLAGARLGTPDGFYQAILNQLTHNERVRLGLEGPQAVTDFRHRIARAMLDHRTVEGQFYPHQRDIAQYSSAADTMGLTPDALGLFRQGADCFLYMDGLCFNVSQAGPTLPWRIPHPTLHDAYAPVLTHNGAGAWRHEWETPLTWDGHKPFYRLGPAVGAWSPDAINQIQQVSGVTPAMLRRVHLRNERPPAILMETIERFTLHRRVKAGVETGWDFFDELLGEIGPESADVLVGSAGLSRVDQVRRLETFVAQDKPGMARLFFKALLHKSALSSEPLAQVLQRDFPSLTAQIAEDLVRNLTPVERRSLEAGRVPLTKTKAIRWWIEYLRKTRAMEGVHLGGAASADSSKLILHTVAEMDGWSVQTRVEVRERGRLIDRVGPAEGRPKRVLEALDGRYQAFAPQSNGTLQPLGNPGDFLTVLLDALPPPERQAVGYTHAGGVEELTQEIGYRLERHWEFAETLLEIGRRPWYNPPRRVADGRIGYPLSGGNELGAVDRDQVARLRQLFPTKTDEQAFEILENLSDSVQEREDAINTLFRERDALNDSLERWCLLGKPEQLKAQVEASARIRRCWSKEDSPRGVMFELYLDDLALEDLPQVTAHFGHVMQLSLRNNQLQALPMKFLGRFPALRTLFLDGNRLDHVPQGLSALQHLKQLSLANNRIQPESADIRRLQGLTRLTTLNLSNNPLGRGKRLNVYALTALEVLKLRNTQLDLLPLWVVMLPRLRTLDLRDNRFKVLTHSDLHLNETVYRAMNLHGNALSQATLRLLSQYRRRPGYQTIDFGLWHDGAFPLPSVERWLLPVPLNEVPQRRAEWALLAGAQMADGFFNLLWNVSSYPPLIAPEHHALRQDITRRVWQLIDGANHNGRLQQILFQAPLRYMSGGIDGWLLCLNEIELAMLPVQMLAGNVDAAGPDFVNYYRALRRLGAIDHHLLRAFPQQSAQEACVRFLAYRIALASSLDLPLALPGRFDAATAVPDAPSVIRILRLIKNEELNLNWPSRLENEEYWVEFLERKYPQRFEAALAHYQRELERATDKVTNGDINEGTYKHALESLAVQMRQAKADLVRVLTLQEWTEFVIA